MASGIALLRYTEKPWAEFVLKRIYFKSEAHLLGDHTFPVLYVCWLNLWPSSPRCPIGSWLGTICVSLSQGTDAHRLYNVENLEEAHKNVETGILLNTFYICLSRSRSSGGQPAYSRHGNAPPSQTCAWGAATGSAIILSHRCREESLFWGGLSLSAIKNKRLEMETCPLRKVLRLMGVKAARGVWFQPVVILLTPPPPILVVFFLNKSLIWQ